LRPEMVELIRDRISNDASLWFAASSNRWAEYLRPYTFEWRDRLHSLNVVPWTPLEGRNDLLEPAERLRSVTLSVPQLPEGAVDMQIEWNSAAAAEAMRTRLLDRFSGEPIDVGGEGEICRLRTPFAPDRVADLVARLFGPAK